MKNFELNEKFWKWLLTYPDASYTEVIKKGKYLKLSDRSIHYHLFARHNSSLTSTEHVQISAENRKLKYALNDCTSEVKRIELLLEEAEKQIDIITFMQEANNIAKEWKKFSIIENKSLKNEATVFSSLSDVHIEEKIDPNTVNGWNKSNPDIIEARIQRLVTAILKTTRELRKGLPIPHLVWGWLGDLISGYIHEELTENNYLSPTLASRLIKEILVRALKTVAEDGEFETITVIGIRGNHGRTTHRKRYSTGYANSYEYLLYLDIADIFKNVLTGYNNVRFIIPKSEFAELEVYGLRTSHSHGDHFNYLGGIGGLEIPLRKWGYKMQKSLPADKRFVAHWHQWMPGGKEIVNGSVIGYSPFSMGKAFEPELPIQHYELLDRNRGLFTVKLPLILDTFYNR